MRGLGFRIIMGAVMEVIGGTVAPLGFAQRPPAQANFLLEQLPLLPPPPEDPQALKAFYLEEWKAFLVGLGDKQETLPPCVGQVTPLFSKARRTGSEQASILHCYADLVALYGDQFDDKDAQALHQALLVLLQPSQLGPEETSEQVQAAFKKHVTFALREKQEDPRLEPGQERHRESFFSEDDAQECVDTKFVSPPFLPSQLPSGQTFLGEPKPEAEEVPLLIDQWLALCGESLSTKVRPLYALFKEQGDRCFEHFQKNPQEVEKRDQAYQVLKQLFRFYEHPPSIKKKKKAAQEVLFFLNRAYLLDQLDLWVEAHPERYQSPKVTPRSPLLEEQEHALFLKGARKGAAPLLSYETVLKLGQDKGTPLPGFFDLQTQLQWEYAPTAPLIEKAVEGKPIYSLYNKKFIQRALTGISGLSLKQPTDLQHLAKRSCSLGVRSVEAVCLREGTEKVYRGPRYLFGKPVHEYPDFNAWFARDLTPQARKAYLFNFEKKKQEVASQFQRPLAKPWATDPFAISVADARLRFFSVPRGSLVKSHHFLRGKVLGKAARKHAQATGDNPYYYTGDHPFRDLEVFGMQDVSDSKLPLSLPTFKKQEEGWLWSQQQLLRSLFRSLNRENVHRVIHRLAPADVHNYVSPLGGEPLSHREAVVFLKDRITRKRQALACFESEGRTHASRQVAQEQLALDREEKLLASLETQFIEQEKKLGRPSQVTIDVLGQNHSVAQPAILERPEILAQNDRKIMLFRHPSGGFSVHVFIGATGINRVDVDPLLGHQKGRPRGVAAGDRVGDMQAGSDAYEADPSKGLFQSTDETTRDGLPKLTVPAGKKQVGQNLAKESLRGSTVMSYYLADEWSFLPELRHFQEKAKATPLEKPLGKLTRWEDLEVQVQTGAVLLESTALRAARLVAQLPRESRSLEQALLKPSASWSSQDITFLNQFSRQIHRPSACQTLEEQSLQKTFRELLPSGSAPPQKGGEDV